MCDTTEGGKLLSGLSLSSDGVISDIPEGFPGTALNFFITVRVRDANNSEATRGLGGSIDAN